MKIFSFMLFLLPALAGAAAPIRFDPPKKMIVSEAVADVRSKPEAHALSYKYDPYQETQVLDGEPVLVLEERGQWLRVQCPEQMEFTHHNLWEGYPGWIESRFLTITLSHEVKREPPTNFDEALRTKILDAASRHLGESYLWGGRSLHDPKNKQVATGVDCSGLVNWSYRETGWLIPRDAHEQYMKARRLEPSELKPADLIFLANIDKPEKIVHVALYKGSDILIEAPQSGEKVRMIPFDKRFGTPLKNLKNGMTVGGRIITFGTFFPEKP